MEAINYFLWVAKIYLIINDTFNDSLWCEASNSRAMSILNLTGVIFLDASSAYSITSRKGRVLYYSKLTYDLYGSIRHTHNSQAGFQGIAARGIPCWVLLLCGTLLSYKWHNWPWELLAFHQICIINDLNLVLLINIWLFINNGAYPCRSRLDAHRTALPAYFDNNRGEENKQLKRLIREMQEK